MDKIRYFFNVTLLLSCLIACQNDKAGMKGNNTGNIEEIIDKKQDDEALYAAKAQIKEENLSGEVIVLSEEEFEATITDMKNPKGIQYKGYTPCIIDFYADWCGPCHVMNPILVELAKENKGKVIIYKVNVDKSPNAAGVFKVMSLPTLVFLKPNKQPVKVEGAQSIDDMRTIIENIFFNPQSANN
ncbi:MAG: thioredoxin family protein [Bacteroidales bacterium]|jgi:thioredoxin|nr:thioredoxin family protein [Bacteroidales bacterium]